MQAGKLVFSSAEALDLSAGRWTSIRDMVYERKYAAAASLDRASAASVGHDFVANPSPHAAKPVYCNRTLFRTIHVCISSRLCSRCGPHAGRIYVVGGMSARRARLSTVEALDPREGRWTELAPMSTGRSSCGIAALQGRLYVCSGARDDETVLSTVECYEPAAGKWRQCAPMGTGRSSMALAPL